MAFDIKIKPLVLFDLEDKILNKEQQRAGAGKAFYEHFLHEITELPQHDNEATEIYGSVKEYVMGSEACKLFYMISGQTLYVMGLM